MFGFCRDNKRKGRRGDGRREERGRNRTAGKERV